VCGCSFEHGALTLDAARDADAAIDARPALVDRGLVARYFIDEAAAGMQPAALIDSAPAPLALPVSYTPALAYTQVATGRGLGWATSTDTGRASIAVAGTKLAALAGGRTWTYELVVDVRAPSSESRIISINDDVNGYGSAALLTGNLTDLRLDAGPQFAAWSGNVDLSRGRTILHVVVDTAAAADRATLHVDGALIARSTGDFAPDAMLAFGANDYFTLGNVEGSPRSFTGAIYYAAVYGAALSESEIANNVAVLLGGDDR
jgi:hypothetical protein